MNKLETKVVYTNSAKLTETQRQKLVEHITRSPLGIYRTAYEMGVLPQTLYRLMAGRGIRRNTLDKVESYLKKQRKAHAPAD
jgi:hypothetical protein